MQALTFTICLVNIDETVNRTTLAKFDNNQMLVFYRKLLFLVSNYGHLSF